jgi:hypothetical protein
MNLWNKQRLADQTTLRSNSRHRCITVFSEAEAGHILNLMAKEIELQIYFFLTVYSLVNWWVSVSRSVLKHRSQYSVYLKLVVHLLHLILERLMHAKPTSWMTQVRPSFSQ